MATKQTTIENPLTVILEIFRANDGSVLQIENTSEALGMKQFMSILNPAKCATPNDRNQIIDDLNNSDLKNNANKRIRLKSILKQYSKHWQLIRNPHFKMVEHWNAKDFSLHVLVFFITQDPPAKSETADKEKKRLSTTFRFLSFLTKYFFQTNFDGNSFIERNGGGANGANNNESSKKTSGFGLSIVKEVCKLFKQKTGQFTKVKKQLSNWAKELFERSQNEDKYDDMGSEQEAPKGDGNNDSNVYKNVGDDNPYHSKGNAHSKIANYSGARTDEKWFWFCDDGNSIKWVPYNATHQVIIEKGWSDGIQQVICGKYKVEFFRNNSSTPCGEQWNYQIHNSWRRPVIKGTPDKDGYLNGTPIDKSPM